MRADNREHLLAAAQRRSTDTRQRAVAALRRLDRAGTPITFTALADAAGVSRSWLYRHPDLRAEIERLRAAQSQPHRRRMPAAQRASEASLRQRLEAVLDASRAMREENQKLRDRLAASLGEQRAANTPTGPPTTGSIPTTDPRSTSSATYRSRSR